jgi:6-phosphogluconolactonase (cycloisomerase 2 family)
MKKKLLALSAILVAVLAAVSAGTVINAQPQVVGAVYTIDNAASNNVWQFNRAADGTLAAAGMFSTMGNGTGSALGSQGALILTNDGKWLCAVDAGSNEITVFSVNATGLTFASKVSSQGVAPISLTSHGNWVYVLNNGSATVPGNIAGFMLNQTGQLTYIEGSNQSLSKANSAPEQIGFNPTGTMLLVAEKAANITDAFMVDSTGVAGTGNAIPSVGNGPYGFAFTSNGVLIISEAASNTMSSRVATDNASLRTVSGAMPTFGGAPCWVAITGNDEFAYTTNAADGTISAFAISPQGILLLTSSVAARVNMPALDLAFSADSQYLYVLNGNAITGFKAYPDGGLWQVTNVTGAPDSATGLAAT